jgi:hypothetical protein
VAVHQIRHCEEACRRGKWIATPLTRLAMTMAKWHVQSQEFQHAKPHRRSFVLDVEIHGKSRKASLSTKAQLSTEYGRARSAAVFEARS